MMREPFLGLPIQEQGELLKIRSGELGMEAHIVEKDDYQACLEGGLRLVPDGDLLKLLQNDFQSMCRAGMFYGLGV